MKLALGTAQFGLDYGIANKFGKINRSESSKIVELSRASGIDTIDTAIAYGDSEKCLGSLGVENFRLVTKIPEIPTDVSNVESWIFEQIQQSLKRLQVSKIYGILLHRYKCLEGENGKQVIKALERLKSDNIVDKIGISIYSPQELDVVTNVCNIDMVQTPLNLVDNRIYMSGWLNKLSKAGIEIHVRSIFLQGLLLMPRTAIPVRFSPWNELWDKWQDWLMENTNVSAAQICIDFVRSFSEVHRIVVGVDNVIQLEELIAAFRREPNTEFPDIASDEENLVNPSRWNYK